MTGKSLREDERNARWRGKVRLPGHDKAIGTFDK